MSSTIYYALPTGMKALSARQHATSKTSDAACFFFKAKDEKLTNTFMHTRSFYSTPDYTERHIDRVESRLEGRIDRTEGYQKDRTDRLESRLKGRMDRTDERTDRRISELLEQIRSIEQRQFELALRK